ncbi:MAG: penicillin-binding protein activator, partial [Betaproteobacteria bacterium]
MARKAGAPGRSGPASATSSTSDIVSPSMRSRRTPVLRCIARSAGHCALAALLALGALSCAQRGPTTRPAPIVERAAPQTGETSAAQIARMPQAPIVAALPPDVPSGPAVLTAPFTETPGAVAADAVVTPDAPGTPAEPRPTRPPPPTNNLVALILPLDVPAFARAADAVRAGFLAAADAAGARANCIVIRHSDDGVLAAFEEASRRGVRVVVGPLLRDDLKTLAISDATIPWTIALN